MAQQMWEYALHAVLTIQRDFDLYHHAVRAGEWVFHPYRPASSMRIGIMGAGVLGRYIAKKFQNMGYSVSLWRRSDQPLEGLQVLSGPLAPFLQEQDMVIALLPHTPETKGLINAEILGHFQEHAALVNLGRGSLIDEEALLAHLTAGKLRHAFLDVFAQEPLPENHPFRHHPNVTVTPHISALSLPEEATQQIAGKITLLESGGTPTGLVVRKRFY
jgi:glyoxylate/hydroxypyruvate reductase A